MTPNRKVLDAESRERVKDVLLGALERPAIKRERFIRDACANDENVRREVFSLLHREGAMPTPARLLEQDAFALRSNPVDELLQAGQRVGPYEVVRPLGAGGMGTVVLARRADDFEKEVALKLVRPSVLSSELVRRFHTERQILARLEHPYIARILDGGTADDGRPYFVMEHVDGLPIDAYCKRHHLDVRRRVELTLKVCEALQTAHQSLVVHRDLKPSNILVTEDGTPKLLDFGIAKVLDQGADVTRLGQRPMTLRYASPEQVEGEPITTASDVYSLGVVLYELLAGRSPYPEDAAGDLALSRAITDTEPPPPSTYQSLDGDLDAIVGKALRRIPGERYGTAEQLAADLRHFLDGRPVLARQGDWIYRAAKLLRRHKVAFGTGILITALVLAFSITATVLWQRAERAQDRSERTAEYLRELFLTSDPDRSQGVELTAREFLRRGLGKIDDLGDNPLLQAELLSDLGRVNVDLGFWSTALAAREKELAALRRVYTQPHAEIARGLNNLGAVHLRMGENNIAERYYREAIAMERAVGGEPETKLANLATILMKRGAFDEAEAIYREILESRQERHGSEHKLVANSLRQLGNLFYARGDLDQAEPLLRRAWQLRQRLYGDEHTQTAAALSSLARVLHAQKKWQEAEDAFVRVLGIRQFLGKTHPHLALTRRDLAALYLDLGENATAAVLLGQAQDVLRRTAGEGSWEVADIESLIGVLFAADGRPDAARTCLEESISTLARVRGETAVYTRNARRRLAHLGASDDGLSGANSM